MEEQTLSRDKAAEWDKIKAKQAEKNEKTRTKNEAKPKPGKTSGRVPNGRIPGR